MKTILIIDDEKDIRDILQGIYEDENYNVLKAAHSEQALALLDKNKIDLIVLDIWLDNSDLDGMQILKKLKASDIYKDIPVLLISGHGNVEMAVNAMKIGAYDFIEKPFKIDYILMTTKRALEQKLLKEENSRLSHTNNSSPVFDIDGYDLKSPAMQKIAQWIISHHDSDSRVLITGPLGTGKKRIARTIHHHSPRAMDEYEIIDVSRLDTETFFTKINAIKGGSIILDNIECMTEQMQGQFLSYLSHDGKNANRIISLANTNIISMVDQGLFSKALYDRLSVEHLSVPALNDRREDIPQIVQSILSAKAMEYKVVKPILDDFTMNILQQADWPYNIAQLKGFVEWMFFSYLQNPHNPFSFTEMPVIINHLNQVKQSSKSDGMPLSGRNVYHLNENSGQMLTIKDAREQFETAYLRDILYKTDGNITKMANLIGMERTALYRKLKSLNINYQGEEHQKIG